MFERAIKAEGEKARAEQELMWLKNTVQVIASRNSVAVMTDEQVTLIINSIGQLVASSIKNPAQLN